jgi:hypothetical protein
LNINGGLSESSSAPLLQLKQNNGRIKWVSLAPNEYFLFVIFWTKKLVIFWRPFFFFPLLLNLTNFAHFLEIFFITFSISQKLEGGKKNLDLEGGNHS